MWGNNETGVVNDVRDISRVAHSSGALYHCDATQVPGKLLPSPSSYRLGLNSFADFAVLSAHKMHGPKGCGVLYAKSGAPAAFLTALHAGGEQMSGLRGGTVNVAGVVGFGAAAERLMSDEPRCGEEQKLRRMRDEFERIITKKLSGIVIVGKEAKRVANTSFVAVRGVEGEALLYDLNRHGICASTGSACASTALQPSVVLSAIEKTMNRDKNMGKKDLHNDIAHTGVRFSFSHMNTMKEMRKVADVLTKCAKRLRSFSTVHI